MTNTRDKYSSVPSSKTNWDPNWKVGQNRSPANSSRSSRPSTNVPPPPPPIRSRPNLTPSDDSSSSRPPPVPLNTRPDMPPPSRLPPPPQRSSKVQQETEDPSVDDIDWTNLTTEDKEVFFDWLDEFFSRFLGVQLSPRVPSTTPSVPLPTRNPGPPPRVNMAAKPQVS
ncbi:hypothetical protein BJ138DRAFT_1153976 [Hygrophoropsis aurantiaca]|uniref:Uncharacterized protein n=1 Tax=Hygrophoropsis aurantiaca TaxID=72124 RepID=A0ACB8AA95_9AGAM|nr:hypothetical protein BJ138DRAFT_1153976 [Hygrophoropsis aurantiaca]